MASDLLKIPKLQGSINYEIWSIQIQAVLVEKGYDIALLDPSNPNGTVKALSLIRLSLANGPLLQTRHISDTIQLWTELEQLYKPKGFSSEFLMCKELFETTLISCDKDIEKYLAKVTQLVQDLKARNISIPEQVIVSWVLNNLTKDYDYITAIITASLRQPGTKIVPIEIYSQLIDESRRLGALGRNRAKNA